MRILFLSPYLPSRVRVRPFHWIRGLAALGHQIHLVALKPPEDTGDLDDDVSRCCAGIDVFTLSRGRTLANAVSAVPRLSTPLQLAYSHHPAAERHVESLAGSGGFDVAHVEHMRGATLASRVRGLPIVFDAVDSISALFAEAASHGPSAAGRLLARLDLGRSRRFEARAPFIFTRLVVTTRQEADAFIELAGPAAAERVVVVGQGVDSHYFRPAAAPQAGRAVVLTGKLSYHANTAAALRLVQRIMPEVWQACPDTPVVLAGKDPPPAVQALARDPRVTVTGYVDDMRTVLAQAAVAACPLVYGRGIQNKVLEALASGVPTVMTVAPSLALSGVPGEHYLVADDDRAFADAVVGLLRDESLRRRLGRAAREYAITRHSWERGAAELVELYRTARAEFDGSHRPR